MIPNLSLGDGVVEVLGGNGAHYLAYVYDVYDPKDPCVVSPPSDQISEEPLITLRFENDWRKREAFPLNRIRLTPKRFTTYGVNGSILPDGDKHQFLREGQKAEVWRSKKEGHVNGFWKCVIKMTRDDFYGVLYESEDKINCKVDGKEFNEIVTKDKIRAVNPNPYFTTNPFFKFLVEVPKDLYALNPMAVKSHRIHNRFRSALSLVAVNYDKRSHRLVCIGFDLKDKDIALQKAIKGAELLAETHFKSIKSELNLRSEIDVLRQQLKNLDEIIKIKENEFEILVRVEEQMMGFAIGFNGQNIKKVLQMPGVLSVDRVGGVDETQNVFRVIATNRASLQAAKEGLQINEKVVNIGRNVVPHIIGKGGGLVQEMTDKSGLISIKVKGEDHNEKPKTYVPFHLIGTSEAIKNAELLITFQMNCIKENLEIDKNLSPRRGRKWSTH